MTAQPALGRFRPDCRLCHAEKLTPFLDLGMQPHSDGFLREAQLAEPEPVFPLTVALCESCGQTQLTYVVSAEYLWNQEYVYDSSVTETGRAHFGRMAADIVRDYAVPAGSLSVDIGSNVGVLVAGFADAGLKAMGVDPAVVPARIANENGRETVCALFSAEVAEKIAAERGRAAVVTGTNVFAHVDDLDDLMAGVEALLDEKGIFVIEAPYLVDLVEKLEYDTVYHQHLSYLSIQPLRTFFARFGMELFDVVRTAIHGGSVRLFVARKGARDTRPIVAELAAAEEAMDLHSPAFLDAFARKVVDHRQALVRMLRELKDAGKTIAGLSAPAKGNTLLNYCGINGSILDFVTERSALKVGRYTPGSRLSILPDAALVDRRPDYALVLAWNFAEEIIRNQKEYAAAGGKFIVPIPVPVIR